MSNKNKGQKKGQNNGASQKKKKGISLSEFQSQTTTSTAAYEQDFCLDEIDVEQQRLILEQIQAEEEAARQNSQEQAANSSEASQQEESSSEKESFENLTDEELARILQEEENSKVAIVIGGGGVSNAQYIAPEYDSDYSDEEDLENIRGDEDLTLDEEYAMESMYDVSYISNANSLGLGGDRIDAIMKADTKVFQGQLKDASAQQFSSRRNKKETIQRIRTVDKTDQSTSDKVMDHRTSMILYKLMNSGIITRMDGCVSSGKESHVYHAVGCLDVVTGETTGAEIDYCIKIFKIVGVSFRRREEYQNSEHRFKDKLKTNSQKNVKKYAEKEMRNLKKLQDAGVSCPTPYLLKDHVILMSFIGKQGFPAPSLRDVNFTSMEKLLGAYKKVILNMRKMYQKAHLIHSDLSEYNILYLHGEVYFIDVSQSVESHHMNAKSFLKNDCQHVNEFFQKQGLNSILTNRELFEYIINIDEQGMNDEELTEYAMTYAIDRDVSLIDQKQDESYFAQVCLPQSTIATTDELFDDTNSFAHRMESIEE
ncbi:predicted protein [Naegleria gruberi]|uniref:non-specific serine/threonine protein kinase n=1 Tax=Naegleria gruberi TaxID=5762 RepID=D2VR17_NAEGR|nr:uncharacterized protein NAEGRDRAFT_80925 [Naegleria gruberi]EFC40812.1 predicted protein [Naegleria gruberi]|eukprot:XP_002673556.1 predicted protein [Naegleria gruberi strain NEG-M]